MSRFGTEVTPEYRRANLDLMVTDNLVSKTKGKARIEAAISGVGLGVAVGGAMAFGEIGMVLMGIVTGGTGVALLRNSVDQLRSLKGRQMDNLAKVQELSPASISRRRGVQRRPYLLPFIPQKPL